MKQINCSIIKLYSINIVLLLCFNQVTAQINFFQRTYGAGSEFANSMVVTTDGGYVMVGMTFNFGAGGGDVYLVRTNDCNNVLWTRSFGGTDLDFGFNIIQTNDGGFAIIGTTNSFGAGSSDFYLIRTDANGDLLWSRTYGGINGEQGNDLIQTSDGGFVIVGNTSSFGTGGSNVFIVRTNNIGNLIWTRVLGETKEDEANSIAPAGIDEFIIVGNASVSATSQSDILLMRINTNGNLVWSRTLGVVSEQERGNGISQTNDGGHIIAAQSSGGDQYIIKLDIIGNITWQRTLGGTEIDLGISVAQTNDDGYIVAGLTNSFGFGSSDVYLNRIDLSGTLLWSRAFGGAGFEAAYFSVAQTADGGYVTAGEENSFGTGGNMYLIKTDPLGNSGCNQVDANTIIGIPTNTLTPLIMQVNIGGITTVPLTVQGLGAQGNNNLCSVLTVEIAHTNILCNGTSTGEIDLTVTGGIAPYTFNWSNGATTEDISLLPAGNYCVNITDAVNHCNQVCVTIIQPTVLTGAIVHTNILCNGASTGAADLTLTGGTVPFNIVWSNGATTEDISLLSAGNYCVNITDAVNNCSQVCVIIEEPAAKIRILDMTFGTAPCHCDACNVLGSPCPGSNTVYSFHFSNTGNIPFPVGTILQMDIPLSMNINGVSPNCPSMTLISPPLTSPIQFQIGEPILPGNTCSFGVGAIPLATEPNGWTAVGSVLFPGCTTPISTNSTRFDACSCDPNDKDVSPPGCGELGLIANQELIYTIRFQNVGTGPAHNIVLRDTLDADLDITSIEILSSTHTITNTEVSPSNELIITFQNINLPGLFTDTLASMGDVKYSIMPKPNLPEGTAITNATGIYFNGNPPVQTNTVINTIVNNPIASVNAGADKLTYFGYSLNSCATLAANVVSGGVSPYSFLWSTGETTQAITVCPDVTTIYTVTVFSVGGCEGTTDTVIVNVIDVRCGKNLDKVKICHVPPGNPSNSRELCINSNDVAKHLAHGDYLGSCIQSSSKVSGISDAERNNTQLSQIFFETFPNPFSFETIINFEVYSTSNTYVSIYDLSGKLIKIMYNQIAEKGKMYNLRFDAANIAGGVYYCELKTDWETHVKKIIIIK